jgi:uncharacterized DUF497 family protein
MRFEWDEAKNRKNFKKHGIQFETAVLVFEDPHALSFQDRVIEDEERWQIFGAVHGRIVMVAHVWREENEDEVVIRLISARSTSSYEEGIYEAHKKSG